MEQDSNRIFRPAMAGKHAVMPISLEARLRLARLAMLLGGVLLGLPAIWLALAATAADDLVPAAFAGLAAGCLAALGVLQFRLASRRLGRLANCATQLARHAGAPSGWADEVETVTRGVARLCAQLQSAGRHAGSLAAANRTLSASLHRQQALCRRYHLAFEQLPQGVLLLAEDATVLACNAPFRSLFGLPDGATRPGAALLPAGKNGWAAPPDADEAAADDAAMLRAHTTADGRSFTARWARLYEGGWLCVCEDTTDLGLSERRLAHMARHDTLTGLPNRHGLADALNAALVRARGGERAWVHYIDLDRFDQVNDMLGQAIGDAVLHEVARRLRAAVREDDTLAYLGSDEFVVIQFDSVQRDAAATLARRLTEVLGHPFALAGESVMVGASIGIAPVEPEERDPDALLRCASLALHRAKQEGRGGWCFFDTDMDRAARSRRELESDLREALHAGQFELFYQPLVCVRERRVCGLEALLRWRHPTRGLIPPMKFIPLAEELGLIVEIGEWVLRAACAAAAQWPASVAVAVNLSSVQFLRPGLFEAVQVALAESGLPPQRLELEITESVLLTRSQATLDLLHRLRAMGIRISMDDFGTGYSSLSYLRSFPFDKLKIDKSFISGQGEENEVIVRAIAALGHSLGMATTAEGVETLDQLERLVADGCTEVQGYFFSPPCPAADIPRLLVEIAVRGACETPGGRSAGAVVQSGVA